MEHGHTGGTGTGQCSVCLESVFSNDNQPEEALNARAVGVEFTTSYISVNIMIIALTK